MEPEAGTWGRLDWPPEETRSGRLHTKFHSLMLNPVPEALWTMHPSQCGLYWPTNISEPPGTDTDRTVWIEAGK